MRADIAALADQAEFYAANREQAKLNLRLLTPAEVMQRFGAPDRVNATNLNGYDLWWCWDEPHRGALEVFFKMGYVAYSECHSPE